MGNEVKVACRDCYTGEQFYVRKDGRTMQPCKTCVSANSAIGMLGDDPALLRRAALYVEMM